jgi:cytochrome P450
VDQELLLRNEYLAAENRILKAKLKGRVRFSDAERARLGEIGHRLGRKVLGEVATVARPDTILAWYRKLVARKFDGSKVRRLPGRPRVDRALEQLIVRMAKENLLLETFRYLFEAGGQPITDRQRTVFEKGVVLMLFGYPKAHKKKATIEDFEEFFLGTRKGRSKTISPRALEAARALPADELRWYENEYDHFDEACSQIMQRLTNICGKYSPLRPFS